MLSMMLAAALSPDLVVPSADIARFERSASLIYITDTVTISTDKPDPTTNTMTYKAHYTWLAQVQDLRREAWIDSRTCPQLADVVTSMKAIEMPKPAPDMVSRPMTLDGVYYALETVTDFSNGTVKVVSNVGSPLATWVDNALAKLAPCLPKMPDLRDVMRMPPKISGQ